MTCRTQANPKPAQPIRNADHLNFIRSMPCLICGGHSVAHHLLRTPEKGMGRKSGDDWAIPLCHRHHTELHEDGNEERYLAGQGFDGLMVASALWAVTGEEQRGKRVIEKARDLSGMGWAP